MGPGKPGGRHPPELATHALSHPSLCNAGAMAPAGAPALATLNRDTTGSVGAVTTEVGLKEERAVCRPLGVESATSFSMTTAPESEGRRAIGPSAAPNGFIGERSDADARLQCLNARYYDPRPGIFVQPDWWEVTQTGVGTDRYGYSFGNPVNNRDAGWNECVGLNGASDPCRRVDLHYAFQWL